MITWFDSKGIRGHDYVVHGLTSWIHETIGEFILWLIL
jgi:hypothetical protein